MREKRLSETTRADDEGKTIRKLFEFGDELGLVDIGKIICTQKRKVRFAVRDLSEDTFFHFSPVYKGLFHIKGLYVSHAWLLGFLTYPQVFCRAEISQVFDAFFKRLFAFVFSVIENCTMFLPSEPTVSVGLALVSLHN